MRLKGGILKRLKAYFLERYISERIVVFHNADSHPRGLKLKHVEIVFLPANTTSFCLDHGIIKTLSFCINRCF